MIPKFVSPEFWLNGFNCARCWAFAKQKYKELYLGEIESLSVTICDHCEKISVWIGDTEISYSDQWSMDSGKMIYPRDAWVPLPNEDLIQEIQKDYLEASNIVNDSPRGACAILRLALQKLLIQLWENGNDINTSIWNLVKKWLNPTLQQAFDTVRIVWNESVHPWEIDMKDNVEIATQLFGLINIIADSLLTIPRKTAELYGKLPKEKLEGIQNRDSQL